MDNEKAMRIWILIIMLLILPLISCSSAPVKADSPSGVVSVVKMGMSIEDVSDIVDIDSFSANHAFVTINCSSLSIKGDAFSYTETKDIESPYFMWLFFGTIVQDLNPAVVAFSLEPEYVIGATRMDFKTAQQLVEWQSDRPFRR